MDPTPTPATDGDAPGGWTCPRCGASRPADDPFCGACGNARPPVGEPGAAAGPAPASPVRTLILGGILLAGVAIAIVVGRRPSPVDVAPITFQPATWTCDGSERSWIATLPPEVPDLVLQLRSGSATGPVALEWTTSRAALEPSRQLDGSYRVTSKDADAPECGLAAGHYALVVLDAADPKRMVAGGELELQP